jgi:hypothetical protein
MEEKVCPVCYIANVYSNPSEVTTLDKYVLFISQGNIALAYETKTIQVYTSLSQNEDLRHTIDIFADRGWGVYTPADDMQLNIQSYDRLVYVFFILKLSATLSACVPKIEVVFIQSVYSLHLALLMKKLSQYFIPIRGQRPKQSSDVRVCPISPNKK